MLQKKLLSHVSIFVPEFVGPKIERPVLGFVATISHDDE